MDRRSDECEHLPYELQAERIRPRLLKNAAESLGASFFALSFEAHGRMGVPAETLLSRLANTSGSTIVERSGFLRWARTLLHVTNMRGVAAVLRETTPVQSGPHLLHPVLETAAPRAGLRSISLAHDPAPADLPRHDPAYMAPTLPLPASASTSALPRPSFAYVAPTSPLPGSAATSAVATARLVLASERSDVQPRPTFAFMAPTLPLPASASTSALARPSFAYMAPTSPLPISASTLAVTTARHALTSERTDVLSHPAFAYPASISPMPASAPAFEHQFLPLHGLRLPPGSAFAVSLLPPVLVPGAFDIASPAVTFADAASAAEIAAALLYIRALP